MKINVDKHQILLKDKLSYCPVSITNFTFGYDTSNIKVLNDKVSEILPWSDSGISLLPEAEELELFKAEFHYIKCVDLTDNIKYSVTLPLSDITNNGTDFTSFHIFTLTEKGGDTHLTLSYGPNYDFHLRYPEDNQALDLTVGFGGVVSTWSSTLMNSLLLFTPVCIAVRKNGSSISLTIVTTYGTHELGDKTNAGSITGFESDTLSFFQDKSDITIQSLERFIGHYHYNYALSDDQYLDNINSIRESYLKFPPLSRYR
jgi:hypothetical protein